MPERVLAIDWSGDARRAAAKIWLAEAQGEDLVRLESGRDREAVIEHLIAEARRDPMMTVGIDFAFSLPHWFFAKRGLSTVSELWALVAREGERWLAECVDPFWGRKGRPRPSLPDHFRRTEHALGAIAGIRPKSAFQIGGGGAVGTGSIRGMPFLRTLRASGFSIWPFDAPDWPRVIEIYPRRLTGPVRKARPKPRAEYLAPAPSEAS